MSVVNSVLDPARVSPHQRAWTDLKVRRLGLGLVLAPLIPFAAMTLIGEAITQGLLLNDVGKIVLVLASVTLAWSLIAGATYLLTVVRWRRRTGRAECLLLGTGSAATLPTAVATGIAVMPEWLNRQLDIGPVGPFVAMIPDCLVIGLFLSPFGLLGGWILWRIGVRPAPLPVPDVTAVFD